ncbi:MAG: hypothetical protein KBG15_18020 [Kofleriaceae bacterium]|nr:hypothetical protein [Kofleriaceae bacterium]
MSAIKPVGFSPQSRWGTIALLLLVAFGFAYAVQGLAWWHVGSVQLGPIESRSCFGSPCRVTTLSWTTGSAFWMRMGYATHYSALLTALIAVMCAAGIASKRVPALLGKMLLISALTAVVPAALFVTGLPRLGESSLSIGVPVFFASAVLAALAALSVFRAGRRPTTPTA